MKQVDLGVWADLAVRIIEAGEGNVIDVLLTVTRWSFKEVPGTSDPGWDVEINLGQQLSAVDPTVNQLLKEHKVQYFADRTAQR